MKTLLFIIPSRSNAGTNSSLSALYNEFKHVYDFKIITMSSKGMGTYEFLKQAFTPIGLDIYFNDYSNFKGLIKFFAFFLKCVKRLSVKLNIDFQSLWLKYIANQIEQKWHVDYIIGYQEGVAMNFAAQFKNPNKITWVHSDYARAYPNLDELNTYNKFKRIICVSRYTLNTFITIYPSLQEKTLTIYNLVDYNRINSLKNLDIIGTTFVPNNFTIVSMGRMDPIKRFIEIPQIAKQIKDKGLMFQWYILGGPCNKVYNDILDKIKEYKLDGFVYLLGNKSNPYPYLSHSNLLVSTSSSEACPMIFNEAYSCGIPVISADFGSATEFVSNGINGYVAPLSELSEILSRLIVNKDEYDKIKHSCSFTSVDNDAIIKCITQLFS